MNGWSVRSSLRRQLLDGKEPEWLKRHPRRDYIVQITLATPPWVTAKMLRPIYDRRGPYDVVDHIIPLKHPLICGLHVPANLQVVKWITNARKGNAIHALNLDLFEAPEQLKLI